MLAQAELNLQHATVKAPVKGVISRKTVEVGQNVQPGQPLMAIIALDEVWVTANFKETQLQHMRPGQRATLKVDAVDGREFNGHVESIAAATGARFSLLPPENATGNFVKVVQRVPVKIVLDSGPGSGARAAPGAVGRADDIYKVGAGDLGLGAGGEALATSMTDQQRQINPWLIAISVMLATFMEVLDTTVVNVSLPHIAGSLSVTIDEATWALTSYLVANAIILPMTGWLASVFGRKNAADALRRRLHGCVIPVRSRADARRADLFRIIQGATGGALQPLSQAVLLESFPPRIAARPWASGASASSSRRSSDRCLAAG